MLPDEFDWTWSASNGSAELRFGEAEYPRFPDVYFTLKCRRNSNQVAPSWGAQRPATLISNGQSAEFTSGSSVAADHPVMAGLRATGTLTAMMPYRVDIVGKSPGRVAVKAFFQFCTNPSN